MTMSELPPFSRTRLLQCDRSRLFYMIAQLALQFLMLGNTGLAMRVVTKVNNYDYCHDQSVVVLPLHLIWDRLGSWPDGEEEGVRKGLEEERKRECGKASARERNKNCGGHPDVKS
ncbi:hypothetical protein OPT61_g2836 [Boeremia exigua]|uniref:Uncharacterized protein n=1 Tax=Boeremia exigua TaxID=749465 RepID=A0ACC2IK34_9PLEO|nr:hypothetical protein OPT61_g2836 [Boeremia exigua]